MLRLAQGEMVKLLVFQDLKPNEAVFIKNQGVQGRQIQIADGGTAQDFLIDGVGCPNTGPQIMYCLLRAGQRFHHKVR